MKRQRNDSVAGAIDVAAKASRVIVVPDHVPLQAEDMPFWHSVIAEFARSEWTDHQLELAAMLARTMADLEREQVALRAEGSVATTERGTPVVNPRKAIIQMHAATVLSFRRSLALHARAQSETRDTGKRRALAKRIESDIDDADDDLIPKLRAVA